MNRRERIVTAQAKDHFHMCKFPRVWEESETSSLGEYPARVAACFTLGGGISTCGSGPLLAQRLSALADYRR